MRLQALAVDYDGTLASHDRLADGAAVALERARRTGLRLILVTGRTFFELTRVCARLDLFDAVVAENGAVLHFPSDDAICDEGPPPPLRLIAELDRRSIPFQTGRVIVGTGHSYEAEVRAVLAAAGVDLRLVRNRAALMLLPAGVSKGSGVRRAMQRLGVSFHDVLAIGDAENDVDLFAACGYAACPGSAVAEVAAVADWVFPGDDGAAVVRAIEGPILGGALPPARTARERIELGWAGATSERVTIPARGVNVLVHGDSLSGKSWLTGGLVERLVGREYATCVIDPEGDYQGLADAAGVTWVEVDDARAWDAALATLARDPAASLVVDLSAPSHDRKLDLIRHGLQAIARVRAQHGRPHWTILDEAHYWLHEQGVADEAAGFAHKGFCLVTYKASWLRQTILDAVDFVVLGCTTAPVERAVLAALLERRGKGHAATTLTAAAELVPPEFVLVPTAAGLDAVNFVAAPRITRHVRHLGKYADQPVAPREAFFFRRADGRPAGAADSLRVFLGQLRQVDEDVLAHHASRGDFSRWIADVFAERRLAARVRKIERRWQADHRMPLRSALVGLLADVTAP
ncbi:MAG TPA: HAD-IIB family hydrolase [Methylomirabilota bacterium]|nr:HAD-IIB family hydrolase [Methylomirabilota bacterium]